MRGPDTAVTRLYSVTGLYLTEHGVHDGGGEMLDKTGSTLISRVEYSEVGMELPHGVFGLGILLIFARGEH